MPNFCITRNSTVQYGFTVPAENTFDEIVEVSLRQSAPDSSQFSFQPFGVWQDGAGDARHGFIQLPALMRLPSKGTVTSATLKLPIKDEFAGGAIDMSIYVMPVKPEVTWCTWNDIGYSQPWPTTAGGFDDKGVQIAGPITLDTVGTVLEVDLTSYVQGYVDQDPDYYHYTIGLFPVVGTGTSIRNFTKIDDTDGTRIQLEVVMLDDGVESGNFPRQTGPITFTHPDGALPPAVTDVFDIVHPDAYVDFGIESNQLHVTQDTHVDTVAHGSQICATTPTSDGVLTATYGNLDSLSGLMYRRGAHGWQFLDTIGTASSTISTFTVYQVVVDDPGTTVVGTSIPAFTPSTSTDVVVRVEMLGPFIKTYANGVFAGEMIQSILQDRTVHGFKNIGNIAYYDDVYLPLDPPIFPRVTGGQSFSIDENATGVVGTLAYTGASDSAVISVSSTNASIAVDSSLNVSVVTGIDSAAVGSSVTADVAITDQHGTSDPVTITINLNDVDESVLPVVAPVTLTLATNDLRNVASGVLTALSLTRRRAIL